MRSRNAHNLEASPLSQRYAYWFAEGLRTGTVQRTGILCDHREEDARGSWLEAARMVGWSDGLSEAASKNKC